ncbi:MAG TPA: SgcJ/EcaC family oxidoreductase [Chloroflexia bacterium]
MDTQSMHGQGSAPGDEAAVRGLYAALLEQWNRRDAAGMAALFAEAGHLVGYDGSVVNGRAAIAGHLAPIFADHPTPAYVGKVREVRFLTPDVAVLRAVSGLVPAGTRDLNPALNAVQSLVAARHDGQWRVELYQNTPAAFHGRPEESAALTAELRALLTE